MLRLSHDFISSHRSGLEISGWSRVSGRGQCDDSVRLLMRRGEYRWWCDPVFWIGTVLYVVNRFVIKPRLGWSSPLDLFFQGHFDDCLLVPVALPLFLAAYRSLGLRPGDAPPTGLEVALHVVLWSLFFKAFAPLLLHASVMDPIDVACYAGGGLVAWFFWRQFRVE